MLINNKKLENWIALNFHVYKKYKDDYLVNSPFKPDKKFKLSISPSKKCYHCWKSDESGPIYKLVQIISKCSKQEAINLVYDTETILIENFEEKIESLKNQKTNNKIINEKYIELPYSFKLINLDTKDKLNLKALKYCIKRKIDPMKWKIGYCDKGKYCGRIIIPFYNDKNELIYWTARTFLNQEPKYLNPQIIDSKSTKKEEIMFVGNWKDNKEIIIVEGILDAISLTDININAISIQGKSISNYQLEYLRKFENVIIGFDNDNPGREAALKMINILKENGINCAYICPPNDYKDWNQCYIEKGKDYIINYVSKLKNNKNVFLDQIKLKIFNKK